MYNSVYSSKDVGAESFDVRVNLSTASLDIEWNKI